MKKYETLREAEKDYKKRFGIVYLDTNLNLFSKIFRIKGRKYKYVICTYLEWLNEFYK